MRLFAPFFLLSVICLLFRLSVAGSAEIVEQKIGPFIVSFDLTNSSAQLDSVESYWDENDSSMSFGMVYIVPKSNTSNVWASIKIMHSTQHNGLLYDPEFLESGLVDRGFTEVQTYTRTIDGNRDGTLTTATLPTGGPYSLAEYRLDANTIIEIRSRMPMDKGTGDLLNTIHVGEVVEV